MSKAAIITILNQGAGVGPFNLYALDADGEVIQTIQLNVPLASLSAGYNVFNLPDNIAFVKIDSNNVLCDASQTITVGSQEPPACNCITFENPVDQTITYSYTDCNGDDSGPLELDSFSAVQVCGSDPVTGSNDVIVIQGNACVSGQCVNGTLVVENYATDGVTDIVSITPARFYSFNTPPTFPDNPTITFPITTNDVVTASRIKYDLPITVTLTTNGAQGSFLQLFRNDTLMETKVVDNNNLVIIFNSIGAYTFNTTDELKLVLINGIN